VRLVTRHPISLAIVLAALACVTGIFLFARPVVPQKYEENLINLADQDTVTPSAVRTAFASEGIRLRYSYDWAFGVVLSNVPPAQQGVRKKVNVTVGGRKGKVDYGPQVTAYDERFENVLVTYDGDDAETLARVEAAVHKLDR
jgi:hypothetical protein